MGKKKEKIKNIQTKLYTTPLLALGLKPMTSKCKFTLTVSVSVSKCKFTLPGRSCCEPWQLLRRDRSSGQHCTPRRPR